jgi:hypothetical protein
MEVLDVFSQSGKKSLEKYRCLEKVDENLFLLFVQNVQISRKIQCNPKIEDAIFCFREAFLEKRIVFGICNISHDPESLIANVIET